jgi:hypothetical protein
MGDNLVKTNSVYYLAVVFLVVSMFSSLILPVSAQENLQITNEPWQPPKNFVDPVTLKIQEFREAGLCDEEITAQLETLGMGWYPPTGATWIGKALSPEEADSMPITMPAGGPQNENALTQQNTAMRSMSGITALMRVQGYSWTGIAADIVAGSMSVNPDESLKNYVCVQMGGLAGITNWAEIVLTHNLGGPYKWYAYDPDDGGWIFLGNKTTASNVADNYVMMLDGTKDNGGYHYDIWINYQWQFRGHLSNSKVQVAFQREVYSETGSYTNDTASTVFHPTWINTGSGWVSWASGITTYWSAGLPLRQNYGVISGSYKWTVWVKN